MAERRESAWYLDLYQTYTVEEFFHFHSIRREQSHQIHSLNRKGHSKLDPCGIARSVSEEWIVEKRISTAVCAKYLWEKNDHSDREDARRK